MIIPARVRSGFTLVEALVALMLFALIAAAGTAVLSVSIDNRFAVRSATDRTAGLQRMRSLLKADLGQATGRRTRDRNGEPHPLALTGATVPDGPVLVLTRAGWSNAGGAGRSSLQRVEYSLVGNRLERRISPFLDGSRPGPPQQLLSGVTDLTVTFVQEGRDSPGPTMGPTGSTPDAVRLEFTLAGYGRLSQLFLVGGGR
ncbi:MAG: type II secretion system minor pseudopilin GspJ [Brevundimonas sp.]|nr:type II secretion system minor pseudopilin GspJ [Brevundimonas sp.]MDZ4062565.1 type II secretion system minor pseudopilin GspJ [Brevundimonas sp.]